MLLLHQNLAVLALEWAVLNNQYSYLRYNKYVSTPVYTVYLSVFTDLHRLQFHSLL